MPVIPASQEVKIGGLQSEASPRQKHETLSKKRAGGVAQTEECLPSKHEALSLNSHTKKTKTKTKKPKLSMVTHACNSSCSGGRGRRIKV
jgi:hypothetical protein